MNTCDACDADRQMKQRDSRDTCDSRDTVVRNCRTGSVQTVRFTLALLDDPDLLERSKQAEGHPGPEGG